MSEQDLSEWIKANMTVNELSILDTHKETMAQHIGITKEGQVILLKDKSQLEAKQMIVLYLIGKYMARLAGYEQSQSARNIEISANLGIPEGTVGRCLRELQDTGYVSKGEKGGYTLVLSSLATFFADMEGKK